jgi:hypothetical protein
VTGAEPFKIVSKTSRDLGHQRKRAPHREGETRSDLLDYVVDRMWHNPDRTPAAQGPVVTVSAVRRRVF